MLDAVLGKVSDSMYIIENLFLWFTTVFKFLLQAKLCYCIFCRFSVANNG
jgi:hypothetical protein